MNRHVHDAGARRRLIAAISALALATLAASPAAAAEREATGAGDFPCHRGYGGDGFSACDRTLVDDLGKARPAGSQGPVRAPSRWPP